MREAEGQRLRLLVGNPVARPDGRLSVICAIVFYRLFAFDCGVGLLLRRLAPSIINVNLPDARVRWLGFCGPDTNAGQSTAALVRC